MALDHYFGPFFQTAMKQLHPKHMHMQMEPAIRFNSPRFQCPVPAASGTPELLCVVFAEFVILWALGVAKLGSCAHGPSENCLSFLTCQFCRAHGVEHPRRRNMSQHPNHTTSELGSGETSLFCELAEFKGNRWGKSLRIPKS